MLPAIAPLVPPLPICSVPALIVVMPAYVLFAVKTRMLAPLLVSAPLPLITPSNVTVSLRLKLSVALSTTSPSIEPVVPPLPICSVPALTVVPPV